MPTPFYRPTRPRSPRLGRSPLITAVRRRDAERARARALAEIVAVDAPVVVNDTPEEYGARWVFLRNRRDTLDAQKKEAQRQMDELGREAAEAFAEQGIASLPITTPSGERYSVRLERVVYPKYLERDEVDDEGQRHARKYGQPDLIAALEADGLASGVVHTTIHGQRWNTLIRKIDNKGQGTLPEHLAAVIEIEPSYGLAAQRSKSAGSRGEPPVDGQ